MPPYAGQTFQNRSQIASQYGGGPYSGIETPSGADYIMIFSNENLDLYQDDFDSSGDVIVYTGTGTNGDMRFDGNPGHKNGAIRDHMSEGKSIWVFNKQQGQAYEFIGFYFLFNYYWIQSLGEDGLNRQAIQFVMKRLTTSSNIASTHQYRPDQYQYRSNLLAKFNSKCVITGLDKIELLIASHIKPYYLCERHERSDVNNGLILSPLYDALFDKFFITFDEYGRIVLSSEIQRCLTNGTISVNENAIINIDENMEQYMSFHRNQFHIRNNNV